MGRFYIRPSSLVCLLMRSSLGGAFIKCGTDFKECLEKGYAKSENEMRNTG